MRKRLPHGRAMFQAETNVIDLIEHIARIAALVAAALVGVWGFVVNRVRAAVRNQRAVCSAEICHHVDQRVASFKLLESRVDNLDAALTGRVENLARDVHNYMGKLDIINERTHKMELANSEEIGSLRTEMREGFARLAGLLDRGFNGKHKDEN